MANPSEAITKASRPPSINDLRCTRFPSVPASFVVFAYRNHQLRIRFIEAEVLMACPYVLQNLKLGIYRCELNMIEAPNEFPGSASKSGCRRTQDETHRIACGNHREIVNSERDSFRHHVGENSAKRRHFYGIA